MSISWPVAMAGGIHGVLTGNDNIRFIARVYGKPFRQLRDFVDDVAQLGKFLSEPVKTYSTGMMGRLNFALSLAVDFDCYLIDEVIAAGDYSFQKRCHEELFEKRADRALILASHVADFIKSYCSRALVCIAGRARCSKILIWRSISIAPCEWAECRRGGTNPSLQDHPRYRQSKRNMDHLDKRALRV